MIPRRPLSDPGRGGSSCPLPPYTYTLFGPFGAVQKEHIAQILSDERWYGDEAPRWRKAPWSDDAIKSRQKATTSLAHIAYVAVTGAASLSGILEGCVPGHRCFSGGCYECCRAFQRWLVDAVGKLLRKQHDGYQDFTFNFVMPDGQASVGKLATVDFLNIMAKCRSALDRCSAVEFAVVAFDTSANDDTEKFRKGKYTAGPVIYFQVHVYGIVRTSDRAAVWEALRPLFAKATNIYRPLHIPKKAFNGSNKGISYLLKPDAFRRVSYRNEKPATPYWTTRSPPPALKTRELVHYLVAMHALGFLGRIALVGLHPFATKATKHHARGVALRRVHRRRPEMQ